MLRRPEVDYRRPRTIDDHWAGDTCHFRLSLVWNLRTIPSQLSPDPFRHPDRRTAVGVLGGVRSNEVEGEALSTCR